VDIHGEYATALHDIATVFKVNPASREEGKRLYIPYWAMNFDELVNVTLGPLDDAQHGIVLEKVSSLKKEALSVFPCELITDKNLTVDTPVPFSIHKMWFDLHCNMHATYYQKKGKAQTREDWAL
ncbi:unnamed protein product, partial [marine sediment metagenome]